jgi:hypothetical protein
MTKSIVLISFIVLFCFTFGCQKQEQVERFMEDGVEVVVNHLEPYKLRGEPNSLILEKVLSIDTESDELAEVGLPDVSSVSADSEGNIYFFRYERSDNFLYKFSKNGKFMKSFGKRGQGPGEIQMVSYFLIDSKDNIIISDAANRKIIFFNNNGELTKEVKYILNIIDAIPLENGKYLVIRRIKDDSLDYIPRKLILSNANFEEIKELDVYNQPLFWEGGNKMPYRAIIFEWRIKNNKIYIGNEQRGYEILVYDFDGNLLRKIRKDYIPSSMPKNLKVESEKRLTDNPNAQQWFYVPEETTPFNSFFIDNEERLFVRTYEKGLNEDEYIHDVFNSDGEYFSRQNLKSYGKLSWDLMPLFVVAKNNNIYCLREKESGYKELVVYKMRWE